MKAKARHAQELRVLVNTTAESRLSTNITEPHTFEPRTNYIDCVGDYLAEVQSGSSKLEDFLKLVAEIVNGRQGHFLEGVCNENLLNQVKISVKLPVQN